MYRTEAPIALCFMCPVISNSIKKGTLCLNSREAIKLTKRDNNGAGDTVGHNNSEDAHHPGISCPKLELIGLVLQRHKDTKTPYLSKLQVADLKT